MINLENIFSLFSSKEDLEGKSDSFIDFTENPLYWILMYHKMIKYHPDFKKEELFKLVNTLHGKTNMNEATAASDFITYNRAWGYVSKIDINDNKQWEMIKTSIGYDVINSLKIGIDYFLQTEEYERCAFLQNILNKSEEFQSKLGFTEVFI